MRCTPAADKKPMSSAGEIPAHYVRARRTAAFARAALAILAIVTVLAQPGLAGDSKTVLAGFTVILLTATVQLVVLRWEWLKIEEALAGLAAVLIVGVGSQRVTVLLLLWIAAVACGVLARGGRIHWIGRAAVLASLAGPIVREQGLSLDYAAFVIAAIALLLTCGRVTRELQTLLESARSDADHDSLTGALARTAFRSALERIATGEGAPDDLALLLISLDVSAINQASGQAARDEVLASVFLRIRATVPREALIGRLGGGVFAVLVRAGAPQSLAERLLGELAREAQDSPAVSAWIGISRVRRDGHDAETVLRAADIALRVAKQTGKGQYSIYEGESLSDWGPGGARSALARVIAGEGLSMHVQPIIDVRSGRPSAYEALARFQSRSGLGPLHWFALADEVGMRDELELACLREGLKLLESRPPDTLLSVNLSGALLTDPRTHELLAGLSSLDGLILELTENSLLEDTPGLHAAIAKLHVLGIRIAIDDMGVGYSGLRQITTVHPTYLKLDRSLIKGIDRDPDRGALVSALIGYATQTGGYLVAEGVETEAELETLEQLGVTLVQGFFLGRPAAPWPAVASRSVRAERRVEPAAQLPPAGPLAVSEV
jgi:diguanylate cyclase (GGDEF)-like protein